MRAWFEIEQFNYDRFLARELSFTEQRRERLREFLPLADLPVPESDAGLDELFAVYLRDYEASWTAFPDAAPALHHLGSSGMMIGVITNGDHDQQAGKIRRIGLEPLLPNMFSSERMGHAKPAARAFLLPCESLQLPPARVLYVGDNYRVDIEGARNAGLQAIHLAREFSPRAETIRSLSELPAILNTTTTLRPKTAPSTH